MWIFFLLPISKNIPASLLHTFPHFHWLLPYAWIWEGVPGVCLVQTSSFLAHDLGLWLCRIHRAPGYRQRRWIWNLHWFYAFFLSITIHPFNSITMACSKSSLKKFWQRKNRVLAGTYSFCALWAIKVQTILKCISVIAGSRGLLASGKSSAMATLLHPTRQRTVCWKAFYS